MSVELFRTRLNALNAYCANISPDSRFCLRLACKIVRLSTETPTEADMVHGVAVACDSADRLEKHDYDEQSISVYLADIFEVGHSWIV